MKLVSASTALVLASLCTQTVVYATPTGAGTCGAGQAITNGHRGSGGSLSSAALVINWGGTPLDQSVENTIGTGIEHMITLTSSGNTEFKGFLLRLSGKNGEDSSSALVVKDSLGKVLNLCADDVIGMTHKHSNKKSSVTVGLTYAGEADLLLEVTVVTSAKSQWVYGTFDLKVAGNATAPTDGPTVDLTSSSEVAGYSSILAAAGVLTLSVATFM